LSSRVLPLAMFALLFRASAPQPAAPASPAPATVVAATAGVRPAPPMSGPSPALREATSDAAAARFLAQATFGPTLEDIERVRKVGYRTWLDEQFALPASYEIDYLDELGP